jgi:hypothetical protein
MDEIPQTGGIYSAGFFSDHLCILLYLDRAMIAGQAIAALTSKNIGDLAQVGFPGCHSEMLTI